MLLALVFLSFLSGPAWTTADRSLELVLTVTQCRASCIDKFTHLNRNKESCSRMPECFMCWEMCSMVMEKFEVWNPFCAVRSACTPGCQLACNFIQIRRDDSFSPSSVLKVKSLYGQRNDRVRLEWVPDRELRSASTILYAVLLKDENQGWFQIAQTTAYVVHIKRGLLSRNTLVRVVGVNATKQLSDSKISHLPSRISDSVTVSKIQLAKNTWKPQLISLEKTEMGVRATIVWPAIEVKNVSVKYEIVWSAIDSPIEITGHLYTASNSTVLTLWPDHVYSVQVNCLGPKDALRYQSESLFVDTKNFNETKPSPTKPSPTKPSPTKPSPTKPIVRVACIKAEFSSHKLVFQIFSSLSALFVIFIIFGLLCILRMRKNLLFNKSHKQTALVPSGAKIVVVASPKTGCNAYFEMEE